MDATASMVACARPDALAEMMGGFWQVVERVEGTFAEREAAALAYANELVRRWIESELARIEGNFGSEVVVDGERYRRHESGEGTYHSLNGPAIVRRCTYRKVGVHNGPTIVPLELATGMIAGATPSLAYGVAQGHAELPTRRQEEQLRAAHPVPPSRSTLERIARTIASAVQRALPVIEPAVRAAEEVPATVTTVSVGLDRTSTRMSEPRQELDSAPLRGRRRPYVRQPPPPITATFRMPYVGTVALHGADGETLVVRRFAATVAEGPAILLERVFAEVAHVRSHRPDVSLVIVQDGAPELWALIDRQCARLGVKPKARLIDWFHVDERLAAALDLVCVDTRSARQLHGRWRTMLERSDRAIDRISRFLDYLHFLLGWGAGEDPFPKRLRGIIRVHLAPEALREFAQHVEYIGRHKHKMRYASARARGFPIGSGITEGACKSVVTARCKRSGQRWCTTGLAACLTLRTLLLSDRLESCFAMVQASWRREIRAA